MWFHVDFNMTPAQRFTLAAQEQHAANEPTEITCQYFRTEEGEKLQEHINLHRLQSMDRVQ